MTLIIGCVTQDFGIMAGDVQLTRKGLLRRGKWQREVEIKVGNYSPRFLMGILGNWGSWYGEGSNVIYTNHYDIVKENIPKEPNLSQRDYVRRYLEGNKEIIKSSAVYIENNGDVFSLGHFSTDEEAEGIKAIRLGGQKLVFNEPYYKTANSWVEERIRTFKEDNALNDNLVDTLFLLNNVILGIIAEGKHLDMSHRGESFLNLENTVGGYVTLQVVTGKLDFVNPLYAVYSGDYNCLLDKTTHPYSRFLDQEKVIRYIDNVAMLVRNINNPHNSNIKAELLQLVLKQIDYLIEKEIVDAQTLNLIIIEVNEKYSLGIPEIVRDKDLHNDFEDIVFDDDGPDVDERFLRRFF